MGSLWTEVELLHDDRSLAPNAHAARSVIARMIADAPHLGRSEIVKSTGLARSTVDRHLGVLVEAGIIEDAGLARRDARGRPAQVFSVRADKGIVLVADVTMVRFRAALITLTRDVLAETEIEMSVERGPDEVLGRIADTFAELMTAHGLAGSEVLAVSIGLPGPVDSHRGMAVRPPGMPGWDGFLVCRFMAKRFNADVLVDNRVNLMALAEARSYKGGFLPLLVVHVGDSVGAGFVGPDGRVLHGADGAASDIGHIQMRDQTDVLCACGNHGCLAAVASAAAMAAQLSAARGHEVSLPAFLEQLRLGDPTTVSIARAKATSLGHVIANLVNFCNPARIVLSGPVVESTDDILARIRSVVYQQAQPLATRNLSLAHSSLGDDAALIGGMIFGIEQVLSPRGIAYQSRGPRSTMLPLGL